MSSKNHYNQGRRTPLSLNASMKMQQQNQGRRPSTNSEGQHAETRSRQQQQQQQHQQQQQQQHQQQQFQQQQQKKDDEKKESGGSVASAAGPIPGGNKQQAISIKNGYNNETDNKSNNNASAPTNGNKVATANEKEIRNNKSINKSVNEEQDVKNGGDALAKAGFVLGAASPSLRKKQQEQLQQQQLQQKQQIQQLQFQLNQQQMQQNLQQLKQQQQEVQQAAVAKAAAAESKAAAIEANAAAIKASAVAEAVNPTVSKPVEEKVEEQLPIIQKEKTILDEKIIVSGNNTSDIAIPKKDAKLESQQQNATPEGESELKPSTSKSSSKKFSVTTAIDDVEIDVSPRKSERNKVTVENPNATSTPGKLAKTVEKQLATPARPTIEPIRNTIISGRRSIRSLTDWTPSKFENNPQFRGSYRRINTELDVTNESNLSMNVTVGSEPGNNTSWFSFHSRKRERTPTSVENVKDELMSPTKRARLNIFSIMATPFTALRSRFARTTIDGNKDDSIMEYENGHDAYLGEEDVSIAEIVDDIAPISESKESSPQKEEEMDLKTLKKNDSGKGGEEEGVDIANTENVQTDAATHPAKKRCNIM